MNDATRINLPIAGMTCASCSARLERVLGAVPGVTEATVNLASETATVAGEVKPAALVAAVARAGFSVPTETWRFAISGMTCASCSTRLERVLAGVPGVLEASVNLATEMATVTTVSGVAPATLIDAVARAGFTALAPEAREHAPAQAAAPRLGEREKTVLALVLAAPLVLPMLLWPFGVHWMPPGWVQLLLAAPVQFWLGARFYRAGWAALKAGSGNMDLLVALGTSAAFGLSVYLLLVEPGAHLYFEASAVIIALVRLGKWLEARARRQTTAAIRALAALRPDTARVRVNGADRDVPVALLRAGDCLVVRPGERIAADATVIEGHSEADESLLTGEAMPVEKKPGDRLTGGAINGHGLLLARVDAVGEASRLAQIIRLVEAAQGNKPPIQRLVDRVSAVFVPAVIGIAVLTFAGWAATGAGVQTALLAAVAVLVIACPCALGLATPAAIMAGTGVAARHGILIRDAGVIEQARRIDTVVFDKTGTLTAGTPQVLGVRAVDDPAAALAAAARLAATSVHPLAQALVAHAGEPADPARDAMAVPGQGVMGVIEGKPARLGNLRMLAEAGIDTGCLDTADWEAAGHSLVWFAHGTRVVAVFALGDALRPGAAEAVAALRAQRIESVLLTGDGEAAARRVAEAVGIAEVYAGIPPEGKAEVIARLRASGRRVAMVGDGINDAPALAAADLGIAMGSGTDVAIESAAMTLMQSEPRRVVDALDIARRTRAKIVQNLFWAFVYNLVGLPLAALGMLSPVLAGAAMAASSVSVVSNALLLSRWRPCQGASSGAGASRS